MGKKVGLVLHLSPVAQPTNPPLVWDPGIPPRFHGQWEVPHAQASHHSPPPNCSNINHIPLWQWTIFHISIEI